MSSTQVVQMGVLELVGQAGLVVKFVLLTLVGASVFCWAVIIAKARTLRWALGENHTFLKLFWQGKNLEEIYAKSEKYPHSPVAVVFRSGFKELKKLSLSERTEEGAQEVQNIHRSLLRASNNEMAALERNVSWLATTASSAPFVGLFGTVWGIMNSFRGIGATGAANLAVVAPGIAEALIATAAGLFAAIPAVIAYNHFTHEIRRMAVDMDSFAQDFLNIVQRSLLGGKKK